MKDMCLVHHEEKNWPAYRACPNDYIAKSGRWTMNFIRATDYSEEAICERDPSYCSLDGTLHDAQTVESPPPEVRRALARHLEQLGMSAVRAAAVARL